MHIVQHNPTHAMGETASLRVPRGGVAFLILVTAVLVLMLLSICAAQSSQGLELRLANGTTSMEGRLEIFYQGEWGTVCDDHFGSVEASVACRQLGLPHAGSSVQSFGRGTGSIMVDDLNCNGNEGSILDCYHERLGKSDCSHHQDVGIVCSDVQTTTTPLDLPPEAEAVLNNGKFRLVDGPDPYQGRVEVFVFAARDWLPICGADWDFSKASFVCDKLGYRPATSADTGRYGQGTGPMANCSGTAYTYRNDFNFDMDACQVVNLTDASVDCTHSSTADVVCNGREPGIQGHIRLVGGSNQTEGRVEVFDQNLWMGLCSDGWGIEEAQVVCRQQGLPPPSGGVPGGSFGSSRDISQAVVDCVGQEINLLSCPRTPRPTPCSAGDAAVRCGMRGPAQELDLRLVDGTTTMEGRLEILYQGKWGTICSWSWFKLEEAAVACRQLGFAYAEKVTPFGPGEGRVVLERINCNGNEDSIVDCYHYGLGQSTCDHSKDVGIVCSNVETTKAPLPNISPDLIDALNNGKLRLVDGPDPYQGRVEVYVYEARTWATICGSNWDFDTASEACLDMDYRPATLTGVGRYSAETGPIATCRKAIYGLDTRDCQIVNMTQPNVTCSHDMGAYVVCNGTERGSQGKVRLVNGTEPTEGRVELFDRNVWKTVCSDDLTLEGAGVVCHQLDMPPPSAEVPGDLFGQSEVYNIVKDVVSCTGLERRLDYCPRRPRETPCVGGDAAVQCGVWKDAQEGDVRLSGGFEAREGHVEVYHNGTWGKVCTHGWDSNDGHVVCRQLGFLEVQVMFSIYATSTSSSPVWLTDLACSGMEANVLECGVVLDELVTCHFRDYAELTCDPEPAADAFELRLVDGPYPNQGRVEVLYNGVWGTICDDGWDLNDATVICRQLGFASAVIALDGDDNAAVYGSGQGEIPLRDLDCRGTEERLVTCRYQYDVYNFCSHEEDIGVVCFSEDYPSKDPRPTDSNDEDGLSGDQIRNIVLGVLIVCTLLLFLCWAIYKYKKAEPQDIPIQVVGPTAPQGSTSPENQYRPVNQNEDAPPTYDDAVDPKKFANPSDTGSAEPVTPPPAYVSPGAKADGTAASDVTTAV